jgi:hypothetical protein
LAIAGNRPAASIIAWSSFTVIARFTIVQRSPDWAFSCWWIERKNYSLNQSVMNKGANLTLTFLLSFWRLLCRVIRPGVFRIRNTVTWSQSRLCRTHWFSSGSAFFRLHCWKVALKPMRYLLNKIKICLKMPGASSVPVSSYSSNVREKRCFQTFIKILGNYIVISIS